LFRFVEPTEDYLNLLIEFFEVNRDTPFLLYWGGLFKEDFMWSGVLEV